jgi:glycosyltransferase involved in cell wall biosynthesis
MRVALVTPYSFPSVRGNSITVQRIQSGLTDLGAVVEVFSLDREEAGAIRGRAAEFRPDVIHGFHASAGGRVAAEIAVALGAPLVVTLTGTDANHDLLDPTQRSAVLGVLEAARAVVAFHGSIRDKVCREAPHLSAKLHVVGQAVRCPERVFDLRGRLGLSPSDFVFLQPAGIRRVKNIPAVLPPLDALWRRHPEVRYVLAGPVIEPEEGARVLELMRAYSWAHYLGVVEHDQLCASLGMVEVVVNSSLSEGGMSNAVLEAMSKGVAVLASHIEGNRSVVQDGETGLLFASGEEFLAKAERLVTDPAFRLALGHRGRQKVLADFPLQGEIDKHLALYRSLLPGKAPDTSIAVPS